MCKHCVRMGRRNNLRRLIESLTDKQIESIWIGYGAGDKRAFYMRKNLLSLVDDMSDEQLMVLHERDL